MDYLLARIQHEFQEELNRGDIRIVITTADEDINREFERVYADHPVEVFYGSPRNLPLRHLQAAQRLGFETIVCVEADDVFCSPVAMRQVYQSLLSGKSIVRTKGLPLGMNNMGYQMQVLENAIGTNPPEILETGWTTIFNGVEVAEINYSMDYPADIRFTMDYPEDFEFLSKIIQRFLPEIERISDESIIAYALEGELYKINSHLADEYWQNFDKEQKESGNSFPNANSQ